MIPVPLSGVWGWPWHGLCTGGVIAGPEKAVTQPAHGSAWLIDLGLPAISLTDFEAAEATANDYEWRNYALLSGGRIYDTSLGDASYLHIDAADVPWRVQVTLQSVAGNTLTLRFTLTRFGLFGHGLATPRSVDASVACTEIGLSNSVDTYSERNIELHDVWTNGAKALVGVVLGKLLSSPTQAVRDLFSVVEVTITGTGGADGSGLSVALAEVIGQPDLCVRYHDNGNHDAIGGGISSVEYVLTGQTCPPGGTDPIPHGEWQANPSVEALWQDPPLQDYYWGNIWARTSYYDSEGNPHALRLEVSTVEDWWLTGATGPTPTGGPDMRDCGGTGYLNCYSGISHTISIEGEYWAGVRLLSDNTVIDQLIARSTRSDTQTMSYGVTTPVGPYVICPTGLSVDNDYAETPLAFEGSLAAHFDIEDVVAGWTDTMEDMLRAFRAHAPHEASSNTTTLSGKYLGVQRIDAKAAALFVSDTEGGARTYGTIVTPLGDKTWSGSAPTGNLYFAWQRKTGDFSFSTDPICYV